MDVAPQLIVQCLGFRNVPFLVRPNHVKAVNGSKREPQYLPAAMCLWKSKNYAHRSPSTSSEGPLSCPSIVSQSNVVVMIEGRVGLYLLFYISLCCVDPALFPHLLIPHLHPLCHWLRYLQGCQLFYRNPKIKKWLLECYTHSTNRMDKRNVYIPLFTMLCYPNIVNKENKKIHLQQYLL